MIGSIIFTTRLGKETYMKTGKRSTLENFKAHKGKVFVVAVLGCGELDKITPEFCKEQLEDMAARVIIKKKSTRKKKA